MRAKRCWIGLAVLLGSAVLGFWVARPLAPSRLHAEIEQRLAEALGGEVRIGELSLSLGWGLALEGRGVEVWPTADGPALSVDRVVASIRPFSHLTGQRRLRRLRLEAPWLRVARDEARRWSPPPAAALFETDPAQSPVDAADEPWLEPLSALEGLSRAILTGNLPADTVEIRGGRIDWRLAGSERTVRFALEGIQARIARRRLFGDTRLRVRTRLSDAAGEQGAFEAEGRRDRSGAIRLAVAATDLELDALAPYLHRLRPDARISGRLSGRLGFETASPGHGHLDVDLVGDALHSDAAPIPSWPSGPLASHRSQLVGQLDLTPQQVRLESARLVIDDFALELDGTLERPLQPHSRADLALTLRDVTLAEARHLIGWLPEVRREEAEAIVGSLESGHVRLLRTGGTSTLSGWQAFLAGRTRQLPSHFVVDAELAETTVRVGRSDRLEDLRGRLWWTGDRMEIRGARARLNATPLPVLELSVEGISHLFASRPEDRALQSGAPPLAGLATLWRALEGDPDDEPPEMTTLELAFERLEHPMFFWPIEDATLRVEPLAAGVRITTGGGRWAGVPVRGQADWLFVPEERVNAQLVARPPAGPTGAGAREQGVWARGRFAVGGLQAGAWAHERVEGRFAARGGEVEFSEVDGELTPSGRVQGVVRADLSQAEAVPFELAFELAEGDVPTLAQLVGLPRALATGRLSASGSLAGSLAPDVPIAGSLTGRLSFEARDGVIRHAVPAVAAIALASEMFNPFAKREQVRYERIQTELSFEAGRIQTDALSLSGPDVRAFAAGSADIANALHPLDVEVVLFLFRPVDWVIEKIPIMNFLLLGNNRNLIAAHFELSGPWQDPEARLVPLRSIARGPGSLVFETLPSLVRRGLEAVGAIFSGGTVSEPSRPAPASLPAS